MLHRIPLAIAILTVISGVVISILFGVNEEMFKHKIEQGLAKNEKVIALTDEAERSALIKSETDKNWRYYQRFHFHATGIGSISIGAVLVLLFLSAPVRIKSFSAWLISLGGFLYPFYWLMAGVYGPEMGRNAAKEKFEILGFMGGVFLLGLIIAFVLSLKYSLILRVKNDDPLAGR